MTEFRPSRFQILPTVVKNLLIINGLVFLAQNTLNSPSFNIDDTFALHAWQSDLFKPWQLVTHLFMHGSLSHIFLNMLALWMFGSVLENVWGSKRFLTFYLICGLGAALMHLLALSYEMMPLMKDYAALFHEQALNDPMEHNALIRFLQRYHVFEDPDGIIKAIQAQQLDPVSATKIYEGITTYYQHAIGGATLGASGAVFGVLAAFGYLFPNTYIYMYALIPVKAKWFVLFYAALEIYEGIANSAGDNVAHWAHVGGALVGLLIVITWNRTNKKTLY